MKQEEDVENMEAFRCLDFIDGSFGFHALIPKLMRNGKRCRVFVVRFRDLLGF